MTLLSLVRSVRLEGLGDTWAAFSPASGDTLLLNIESAVVIELLERGDAEHDQLCAMLAADIDLPASEISARLEESWPRLIEAGLVRAR